MEYQDILSNILMCLRGHFWMSLILELVESVKQFALPNVVGILQ